MSYTAGNFDLCTSNNDKQPNVVILTLLFWWQNVFVYLQVEDKVDETLQKSIKDKYLFSTTITDAWDIVQIQVLAISFLHIMLNTK